MIEFDGITPRQTTTKESVAVDGGLVPVELLYWEQGSHGVLNFQYKKTGTSEWQTLDLTNSMLLKPDANLNLNELQDVVKQGGKWAVRTGAKLDGSEVQDTIIGSDGRDLIFGDGGNDKMTGGTGADTFVLSTKSGNGNDVITDFAVGTDKIALSSVFNLEDIDVNAPNWLNQNSVNNLSWNDGNKTLSYQTQDGTQNSVTFQGVTKSYANANDFLAENLATGDVYVMEGAGNSLSLSQLTDYEVVDLTGNGNNTLTDVTLSNLINNSNSGLHIKGNAGDVVNLGNQAATTNLTDSHNGKSGTWQKAAAPVVEDGVTYDVWQNTADADNKVFIQQGITVL